MSKPTHRYWRFFATLGLVGLIVAACSLPSETPVLPTSTSALPTASPTTQASETPSPTPTPPRLVLLSGPGVAPDLGAQVQASVLNLAADQGLRLEFLETLSEADLQSDLRMVVVLSPQPELANWITQAPQTQFVTVGVSELLEAPNLYQIAGDVGYAAQQGFIGGYLAAMTTPNYRVGVLSTSDTEIGQATRRGFINGARYYCGQCTPNYPPFAEYPQFVEVSNGSSLESLQQAADLLLNNGVRTVYVAPGVVVEGVLDYLAAADVILLGAQSPPEDLRTSWLATVQVSLEGPLTALLTSMLGGQAQVSGEEIITLSVEDVNSVLFSPGRQAHLQEVLDDLQSGLIDPDA